MQWRCVVPLCALVALFLLPHPLQAETRLALVIGNSAYDPAPKLKNAVNDAKLMTRVLESVGFSVVTVLDADKRGMERAMTAFARSLRRPKTVGLFYFAGHGIQHNGMNYLVPVDADIEAEDEIRGRTLSVGDFLGELNPSGGGEGRLNIVILDACRNNPFARGWRSAGRGLAQMDSPSGTLISFSTSPNEIALDGRGKNSPFTEGLARAIVMPGVPVEQTFKTTRQLVHAATAREKKPQVPWESTSLIGDFYFVPAGAEAVAPPSLPAREDEAVVVSDASGADRLAAAEPDHGGSAGCIAVGGTLAQSIPVEIGTQICPTVGEGRATIDGITSYSVTYSVAGHGRSTCRKTEVCSFRWPGAPLFRVDTMAASEGRFTGSLIPVHR